MASRNAAVLESEIEEIRSEIEIMFQDIIACVIRRKNALLQILEESVQLLGSNFAALLVEHTELLRMRDQIEESLNKNQFSDLRIDMLGPLQSRISDQENKIQSNFKLEFHPTGFDQLVNTLSHFGEVSTKIPVPPPNMPGVIDCLNRKAIPLPPPDYPNLKLVGCTSHTTRISASVPEPLRNPHRIPLPPPDIPRPSLFEHTPPIPASINPSGTQPGSYTSSSVSNPRLRAFFSLLLDKN